MSNYAQALREAGFKHSKDAFYLLGKEIFMKSFSEFENVEKLTHTPLETIRYCSEIRKATNLETLDDTLIIDIMIGYRKNKEMRVHAEKTCTPVMFAESVA